MKVEQEQLNRLAARARAINNHLLEAMMRLQKWRKELFYSQLWEAQRFTNLQLQELKLLGAREPEGCTIPEGTSSLEVPLHLLNTPASRRYARAIREAAEACGEMEAERGIFEGLAEQLASLTEFAEMELHGPAGSGLE